MPILNEDRTAIIKDHSLKTYPWTGKIATWQKHKNVAKPKLNCDTDRILLSSNRTLSLLYGRRWLLPGVLHLQLILKMLKAKWYDYKVFRSKEENYSWTENLRWNESRWKAGNYVAAIEQGHIEISLPREGSLCISFFHGSNGRSEPWHLLLGFICSGRDRVSCVFPQAPFTVNKDRHFQGALFLTYFRCLF